MFKVGDRVERREENKDEYYWKSWKPQGEIFTVTKIVRSDADINQGNIFLDTCGRKFSMYKFKLLAPKRSVRHHFSDLEIAHDK